MNQDCPIARGDDVEGQNNMVKSQHELEDQVVEAEDEHIVNQVSSCQSRLSDEKNTSKDQEEVAIIEGQVIHKRCVSKKICFVDIVDSKDRTRKCCVLKSWICGENRMKNALKSECKIHCGDIFRFAGQFRQGDDVLNVQDFKALQRFSETDPGKTFLPIPPKNASFKESGDIKERHCKFWLNSGRCPKADCSFSHGEKRGKDEIIEMRKKYVKERLNSRLEMQIPRHREGKGGGDDNEAHNLASRHQRAAIFASWIESIFFSPAEMMMDGAEKFCVLDVAGGRGDLGFELGVKRQWRAKIFVIDPRGQRVKRWQQKWLRKLELEEGGESLRTHISVPEHIHTLFGEDLFDEGSSSKGHPCVSGARVSLVLGLHPDEATEAIFDISLRMRIPFAVIPCCLFSHLFPRRRLRKENGVEEEPRNFDSFIQYLMKKDKSIKKDNLGFRGRDTVLYWKP